MVDSTVDSQDETSLETVGKCKKIISTVGRGKI